MNERQLLAAAIGGNTLPPESAVRELLDAAIEQRVAALLTDPAARASLTAPERDRLREHVRGDAVRLAALDIELRRVLDALAAERVTALVLKGAHLAHAVYPRPWLRPRADTDLLIHAGDRDRVADALERCGYRPSPHVRGRLILGQFHFERIDRTGLAHYLDVHWRVAAPLLFDSILPADGFFETAKPLPAQGSHARVPDMPQALLLACVHLAAHHRSNPLLIWLYDLRLLVEALDETQRQAFVDLARRAECCAIAAYALRVSEDVFASAALADLIARVDAVTSRREASSAVLRVRRPAGALWMDLRTAGWRDRAVLLREHLLPDRAYMSTRSRPLALAYVVRAAGGLRRWLARSS